jgi:hypothetical protein
LDPEAKEAIHTALLTTLQYILGLRNGACYRYEGAIERAKDAVHLAHVRDLRARVEERRRQSEP